MLEEYEDKLDIIDRLKDEVLDAGRHATDSELAMGYFWAIVGGLGGFFIGQRLLASKVMVEGKKILQYNAESRKHGKRMIAIAAPIWGTIYLSMVAGILYAYVNLLGLM